MTIVLALGGSVAVPDQVDERYAKEFAAWAKEPAENFASKK